MNVKVHIRLDETTGKRFEEKVRSMGFYPTRHPAATQGSGLYRLMKDSAIIDMMEEPATGDKLILSLEDTDLETDIAELLKQSAIRFQGDFQTWDRFNKCFIEQGIDKTLEKEAELAAVKAKEAQQAAQQPDPFALNTQPAPIHAQPARPVDPLQQMQQQNAAQAYQLGNQVIPQPASAPAPSQGATPQMNPRTYMNMALNAMSIIMENLSTKGMTLETTMAQTTRLSAALQLYCGLKEGILAPAMVQRIVADTAKLVKEAPQSASNFRSNVSRNGVQMQADAMQQGAQVQANPMQANASQYGAPAQAIVDAGLDDDPAAFFRNFTGPTN